MLPLQLRPEKSGLMNTSADALSGSTNFRPMDKSVIFIKN